MNLDKHPKPKCLYEALLSGPKSKPTLLNIVYPECGDSPRSIESANINLTKLISRTRRLIKDSIIYDHKSELYYLIPKPKPLNSKKDSECLLQSF